VPASEESAGFSYTPTFSRDGKSLFYLRRESPGGATELWRADLESEKSAKVVPGFSILEYDISTDGREVVFSAQSGQTLQIWLAAMEQSAPPQIVCTSGGDSPHFGPDGEILFRLAEGDTHYLARMNRDGSGRSKVIPYPIGNVEYISPDRRWMTTISPLADGSGGVLAVPTAGGAPRIIAARGGPAVWGPNGKFFYVYIRGEQKTAAIPVPAGETLPKLPASGISRLADLAAFPGSRVIDGYRSSPGPDPSIYARVKTTVHRNLFRISLPK
jgi:Tol biopolymer transport system component